MDYTKILTRTIFLLFIVPIGIFLVGILFIGVHNFLADRSKNVEPEAIKNNNPVLCDKINAPFVIMGTESDRYLRRECRKKVALEHKNPDACYKTDSVCLDSVVRLTGDVSACNLYDPQYRFQKGWCYGLVAIQKKSDTVCASLHDRTAKEGCYISFSEKNTIDASFCEKHFQDEDNRQRCFAAAAEDTKDERLCQKARSFDIDNCIVRVRREGWPRF